MQRRKGDQSAQRGHQLRGYALWSRMIRAAMDQAMTDRGRLWQMQLLQHREGRVHRCLVVRDVTVGLRQDFLVCVTDPQIPT